jgi:hypothetical protein
VSPIFIRPVREQLEHDRLIRFLQPKYKKKFEAADMNVGDEQSFPVKIGAATFFPDLVLSSGKKLGGVVEVETAESVNNLEAMAQWVHFSRARVPFHLYVPVNAYDAARRLSDANQARIAELWTYRPTNDGFDLVRMFHDASAGSGRGAAPDRAEKPQKTEKPAAKPAAPKPQPAKPAKAAKPVKPAAKPAVKPARPAKAKPAKKAAKPKAVKPAKKKKR